MKKSAFLVALFFAVMLGAPHRALSSPSDIRLQQWTPPTNLFETEGRASEAEVVTDPSGVVHVFWAFGAPGQEDSGRTQALYYTRLTGDTWSEPVDVLISPGGRVARLPAVVCDPQGYLHIVWQGGDSIFYSKAYAPAAAASRGWTSAKALTTGATSLYPAIAASQAGELYAIWSQGSAGLMFARSENGGESWTEPRVVYQATGPKELAASGRIAVDETGRLHVVFTYAVEDADPASPDIHVRNPHYLYYLQSTDRGETWSEPLLVTPEPDYGEINVATSGADVVHLVWNGRAGRTGRYHQWSRDGGKSWSSVNEVVAPAPQNPIGTGGLTGFPALVTDSTGMLHLVTATGSGQYYLRWSQSGWTAPVLVSPGVVGGGVTNTSRSIEQPSIALSEGNRLHVVFHDGFERIWYTSTVTDAPYQPPQPLPTPEIAATAAPAAIPTAAAPPDVTPTVPPAVPASVEPRASASAIDPVLIGVLPALLLVGFALLRYGPRRRR